MSEYRETEKQLAIINEILKAADAGEELTTHMLHKRLPHLAGKTMKTMHISILALERYGLVAVRRRGTTPSLLMPTTLAYQKYRRKPPGVIE